MLLNHERYAALEACDHLQRAALTIVSVLRGEMGVRMMGDLEGQVNAASDALGRGGWISKHPTTVAERNVAALLIGARELHDALHDELDVVDGPENDPSDISPNDAMRYMTAGEGLWRAMHAAGAPVKGGE